MNPDEAVGIEFLLKLGNRAINDVRAFFSRSVSQFVLSEEMGNLREFDETDSFADA